MHHARAIAFAHVVGQVHRREAAVALVHVVQGVFEVQAAKLFAQCGGDHGAGLAEAFQAFVHQGRGQHQIATRCVHQGVGDGGIGIERLVGRNGPGGGGPDHGKSRFGGRGQGAQAKGRRECGFVGRLKSHIQGVAFLVGILNFKLSQAGAAVKAPVHGLETPVDKTALDDAFEGADLARLIGKVHGAVGALPVAQHAQAFEIFALLVDLCRGKGAALGLHVVAAEFAAVQLFDRVFNRQAMAVPPRDVLGVKACELLGLDDHVLEHFVQRMADVQLAVGIGRAIVQHKQRRAVAGCAQTFVQPGLVPCFDPTRLALGQVAAHREGRVGQVQGAAVVNGVGHRKSLSRCPGGKKERRGGGMAWWQASRLARGKVRWGARSNSGAQPGARVVAVALYPLGQGVQTVVFAFVVQFM